MHTCTHTKSPTDHTVGLYRRRSNPNTVSAYFSTALVEHMCWICDRSREGKRTTCGAVQFSVCSLSLCRAAGCAYLLLWSVEHKELEMSWKGANPFFLHPHAAHISSSHPGLLLDFLQPMVTLHVFMLGLFADVGICWFQNLLIDPLLILTPLDL